MQADKAATAAKLKFAEHHGSRTPSAFEGEPKDVLETSFSAGPFEESGLKVTLTQINEEAVEANAAV